MPVKRKRNYRRPIKRFRRFQRRYNNKYKKSIASGQTAVWKQLLQPNRLFAKLKYVDIDTVYVNMNTHSFVVNTYNLNGMYDVNTVPASTTVPGFWEIGQLYKNYRVHAAKVNIEFCNSTTNSALYLLTHAQTPYSPSTFTSWSTMRKLEGNRWTKCNLVQSRQGGPSIVRQSMYINCAALYGSKAQYLATSNTYGDTGISLVTGSNPTDLLRMFIVILTADSTVSVDPALNPLKVSIEFYTEYFNKIDLIS